MRAWIFVLLLHAAFISAESLSSPRWGFKVDLPPDYRYTEGNGQDRFSFAAETGNAFDLTVYKEGYESVQGMAADLQRRLGNRGKISAFNYYGKRAALVELSFEKTEKNGVKRQQQGWGLCVELSIIDTAADTKKPPLLLALSYGPAGSGEAQNGVRQSCIDSICPSVAERYLPGPFTEYRYPRTKKLKTALAALPLKALFAQNDAEAAQALVDREFGVLNQYSSGRHWKEAWARFYRAIYKDSWERLKDAAFQLERHFNQGPVTEETAALEAGNREFAGRLLGWVQGFAYERDLLGSDFVNLVSAVSDGRGDCDSRAMVWAIVLAQSCIPSGVMVSREYSHAMGLADLKGPGARLPQGKNWLVAETTAKVSLGLIAQEQSDIAHWLEIMFE